MSICRSTRALPKNAAMDQNQANHDLRLSWVRSYSKRLIALAGQIGLAATDSDETALRKRLAVVLCVGTLPLTILWSVIYLVVGAPLAAAFPAFYSAFTPINTAIFARTRNFALYRFTQLLTILILPGLVMMSLGASGSRAL